MGSLATPIVDYMDDDEACGVRWRVGVVDWTNRIEAQGSADGKNFERCNSLSPENLWCQETSPPSTPGNLVRHVGIGAQLTSGGGDRAANA